MNDIDEIRAALKMAEVAARTQHLLPMGQRFPEAIAALDRVRNALPNPRLREGLLNITMRAMSDDVAHLANRLLCQMGDRKHGDIVAVMGILMASLLRTMDHADDETRALVPIVVGDIGLLMMDTFGDD